MVFWRCRRCNTTKDVLWPGFWYREKATISNELLRKAFALAKDEAWAIQFSRKFRWIRKGHRFLINTLARKWVEEVSYMLRFVQLLQIYEISCASRGGKREDKNWVSRSKCKRTVDTCFHNLQEMTNAATKVMHLSWKQTTFVSLFTNWYPSTLFFKSQ